MLEPRDDCAFRDAALVRDAEGWPARREELQQRFAVFVRALAPGPEAAGLFLALAASMPLLVAWTDAVALLGGMVAARIELGIGYHHFLMTLPDAVPIANLWLGLGKGAVFGVMIALVACHFGLRIEPNTESLGMGTTDSVVTSITVVILVDAVFAILFKDIGIS